MCGLLHQQHCAHVKRLLALTKLSYFQCCYNTTLSPPKYLTVLCSSSIGVHWFILEQRLYRGGMMLQEGPVQLLCLTAHSGVPLFTRGSSKQLPFSVIGSLNGVHMFGGGQGVSLLSSDTGGGGKVVWRVFKDTVMLIAVSGGQRTQSSHTEEEMFLQRLLENVWGCMVLVLGQDELVSMRNVERLKRDLRACFSLIDLLLEERQQGIMGNLTHCADSLLPAKPALLQEVVGGFAQAAESEFGCLIIHGRIAAVTDKWSHLQPQEVVLLLALMHTLSKSGSSSCDYPVFLPQGSPTVALRLLRFQLLPGADVCVLCGPTPSLHKAESDLRQVWSPVVDSLRDTLAFGERCLPPSVALRQDVLSMMLINRDTHRSISCVQSLSNQPATLLPSRARCWELLKLFYIFSTTRYFHQEENLLEEQTRSSSEDFVQGFSHQPLQCYLVTEECKCYGLQTAQHQLFLLLPLSVPTFTLRSVANQTLSHLVTSTGF